MLSWVSYYIAEPKDFLVNFVATGGTGLSVIFATYFVSQIGVKSVKIGGVFPNRRLDPQASTCESPESP